MWVKDNFKFVLIFIVACALCIVFWGVRHHQTKKFDNVNDIVENMSIELSSDGKITKNEWLSHRAEIAKIWDVDIEKVSLEMPVIDQNYSSGEVLSIEVLIQDEIPYHFIHSTVPVEKTISK